MEITKSEICVWKVLLASLLLVVAARAECNVCQTNGAACVNTTSFHLCFGESSPNTDVLYHCKDGFDCTDLNAICVQSSSTLTPSCGDTSLCGFCSAHRNYLFACTSRTTFQMCYGATHPTGQTGYCPDGYLCDASSDAICVHESLSPTVTCDLVDSGADSTSEAASDSSTDSSSESTSESTSESSTESSTDSDSTTTTSSSSLTPNEVCATMATVGLFPTIPSDPNCLRYISCYYSNGVFLGTEYNCYTGSYYNIEREQCVFEKPSYCT